MTRLKRFGLLAAIIGVPTLAFAGWNVARQVHCFFGCAEIHNWHERLTVTVETPQGERSGHSVRAVHAEYYKTPPAMTATEVAYRVTGEAAMVEIVSGRYLFAAIDSHNGELFFRADPSRFKGLRRGEWLRLIPEQTEGVSLSDDLIPKLYTFSDPDDPGSVRPVDPADLSASFETDVQLISVSLDITDAPVTNGVLSSVLPWITDPSVFRGPKRNDFPLDVKIALDDLISPAPATED